MSTPEWRPAMQLVWDTDQTTHFCPPDADVEITMLGRGTWLRLTMPATYETGRRVAWVVRTEVINDLTVIGSDGRAVDGASTRPAVSGAAIYQGPSACAKCGHTENRAQWTLHRVKVRT